MAFQLSVTDDDYTDGVSLAAFEREARRSKKSGIFLRYPTGVNGKHRLFYRCIPNIPGCITLQVGPFATPVLPFKTKLYPKTYHQIITPNQTWAPIEGQWEALLAIPHALECENIARAPFWNSIPELQERIRNGDIITDDEEIPAGQKTPPRRQNGNSQCSTEPDSPRPPYPLEPLVFINGLPDVAEEPDSPGSRKSAKNLVELLPRPTSTAMATNPVIQNLARITAEYNAIFEARQRHALLLADGTPPILPLPRAFQTPIMHRLATVEFVEKLNSTMVKCASALSKHLIEAGEKALEKLLTEAANILVDYTPDEVELKAISTFSNLRTKNLTKFKDAGGPVNYFSLIDINGRPSIQPSAAPTKAHTTGNRPAKKLKMDENIPTPLDVTAAVPTIPLTKAAKRRIRKNRVDSARNSSPQMAPQPVATAPAPQVEAVRTKPTRPEKKGEVTVEARSFSKNEQPRSSRQHQPRPRPLMDPHFDRRQHSTPRYHRDSRSDKELGFREPPRETPRYRPRSPVNRFSDRSTRENGNGAYYEERERPSHYRRY